MSEFDRSATYYKIIGKNRRKYLYKLRLNTLADNGETFNEEPICGPGGLYFCSIEHIFEFLDYGDKICMLTIPKDARVIKVDNKYKADKIYINEIIEINYDTLRHLIKCGADVASGNNEAIRWASARGHFELVKWLVELGASATADNNYPILCASIRGNLEILKYLVEHGADITARNNRAICCAAKNGHFEIVKYLTEHGADITADNNLAIRWAAQNGHLDIVQYLAKHGAIL